MSSMSCFMHRDAYKRYYEAKKDIDQDSLLGRQDTKGDFRVCGMPSKDADAFLADHTNQDGSLDYRGMEFALGLSEGTFDQGVWRVDFEAEGEIRPTEKGGPNDNGLCTGDGKLPGRYSDLEAFNVPRENITSMKEVEGIILEKNRNTIDEANSTKVKSRLSEIRNMNEKRRAFEQDSNPPNLGKKHDKVADKQEFSR